MHKHLFKKDKRGHEVLNVKALFCIDYCRVGDIRELSIFDRSVYQRVGSLRALLGFEFGQ